MLLAYAKMLCKNIKSYLAQRMAQYYANHATRSLLCHSPSNLTLLRETNSTFNNKSIAIQYKSCGHKMIYILTYVDFPYFGTY
jgi:hypothetical protein